MAGKRFSLPVFLLLSLVLLLSAAATFAQEADTTTTGGIYGRIKGTVTAESDGSPLRGINVEIYPFEGSDWAYDEPYAWIGTDSAGAYTLRGLEPGIYRVIFRDSSGQYLDEYYDNAPGWYWATRVMVLAGQATKNINAELQEGVPPVNDDFDNAIEISSLPYYDARPTYGATIAGDDPTLCGHLEQGPSVWYRFTPQVDQSVAISSIGSDYDTVLALWQGERGALDLVDCSDDLYEGQLYLAAVLYSNRLTAGVTYYIEAAGKNTGSLRFSGLPLQPGVIYVSPDGRQTVEGIPAHRADILIFDEIEGWEMLFDASDVGIPTATDLHAFSILNDGSILLTFDRRVDLPQAGTLTPRDIARFIPIQLGPNTAGSFEIYFDGSDAGLRSSTEKIEALHFENGALYMSTNGAYSVPVDGGALQGTEEDILLFTPSALGTATSGSWEIFLDGSEGPFDLSGESIQSLWLDQARKPYLSLTDYYGWCYGEDVGEMDIFAYESCYVTWRGEDHGFYSAVDGLHIGPSLLAETGTILGKVTAESNGLPLPGITVRRYQYNGSLWEYGGWTMTNDYGQYRFLNVEPGNYHIEFEDGAEAYKMEYYDNAPDMDSATDVEVVPGRVTAGINAELAKYVPPQVYVSANREHSVDGLSFARGDILTFDEVNGWQMIFDASGLGISPATDLHAFSFLENGSILMTFDRALTLPGLDGKAKPWDIVKFTPDMAGDYSAGSFSLVFDGSDVGLSSSGEKIDALDQQDGNLFLSVIGRFAVNQDGQKLIAQDEDVLKFIPAALGDDTSGVWELFIDGSEAYQGLAREDIVSLSLDSGSSITISLAGDFNIEGIKGGKRDILELQLEEGNARIVWRGHENGYKSAVDGQHIHYSQ